MADTEKMVKEEKKEVVIKKEVKGIKIRHLNPREYDEFCDRVESDVEDKRPEQTKIRKMILWFAEKFYGIDVGNNDYTIFDLQELFDNTLAMTNEKTEAEEKN